jgi:hypothetical protein
MNRFKKRILSPLERRIFYGVTFILWLTGTIWLFFRYGVPVEDEFGPQTHSAQTMMLKIHGLAAMAFLFIVGELIHHIRPGWRRKQQRPSGASLLFFSGFLILTGWGLYYAGDERFRNWMSAMHSIIGFLLPVIIFLHVWNVYRRLKIKEKEL